MKVLLVGLGRWGCEVVDRFHLIRKKTAKRRPRDVLSFGRLDPIKNAFFFLSLAEGPSNLVFIILYVFERNARLAVVFAFYVFLIAFALINLLMYVIILTPLGPRLLKIRLKPENKDTFEKIRNDLQDSGSVHIINEGEKATVYKYLQFQKKTLFTTLVISVIISCSAAVYFTTHYDATIGAVLQFIEEIFLRLRLDQLFPGREALIEYLLTSVGIPFLLSLVLRSIILMFYLPQIDLRDVGKEKAEKILRSNVDCVGISFHDDIGDLKYIKDIGDSKFIEKTRIIPERRRDLREVLRDHIMYIIDKKVTKEGKVYDAVMFFGVAGSDIVQVFSEIAPFFKSSLMEPLWFYLRFSDNFLTEENQMAVKKLLMEMDCVFVEEEKGRIFAVSPDEEDYVRERILERLFAIGECVKTKSIRAIDVGDIKNMARKRTFSTLAYGYLELIPEEMKDNYKLITELYTLTSEERSLVDLSIQQAGSALATVKRQANEPEEGPIFDYDAIKELLWDKFGENIRVYDIEYVLYDLKNMDPVEIDEIGIPRIESGEQVFIVFHEDEEGNMEPIRDRGTKRLLIDILECKNLLVEDVKRKELWMMFSGIDPDKILERYMSKAEYEKDFFDLVSHGLVMDPSTFLRIPSESLEKFIEERASYRIGSHYVSPLLFEGMSEGMGEGFVMSCLEALFPDVEDRREIAKKLIAVYNEMRTQVDPIIRNSDSVISASRVYVHDLVKAISSKTGMKVDSFSTRMLAEMAWLSHSLDVPIITLGVKGIEPELLSVYRKMAENFGVEPENITERFRSVLRDWQLSQSGVIPEFSDLYLINIHCGYESGQEGIVITAIEYMGGISGRSKRENTGDSPGS